MQEPITKSLLHGTGSLFGEVAGLEGETKMPWFIEKRGDEWCVVKGTRDNPIEVKKCYATESAAKEYMDALYANEPGAKGIDGEIQDVVQALQLDETDKATWTQAYVNDLPDSSFLYVENGKKDDEGKTTPRNLRHLPYKDAQGNVDLPHLRNAISRLGQRTTGRGNEGWLTEALRERLLSKARGILENANKGKSIEPGFTVYKQGDKWRWRSVSSVAVMDREEEIVSEKAYDDAIAYGREHGFGELDLVHVNGTDVGDCDLSTRLGSILLEEGDWRDTPMATKARQAVAEDPDYWGVSLKFVYDPDQFDGTTYKGGIRILKRTILPREMAASHHTAIIAEGGTQMGELDEGKVEALKKLGQDEATIEDLAEKNKALDEEQENVVEKEAEEPTILDKIKKLLGITGEPASEVAEPASAEKEVEVEAQDEATLAEQLKAFGATLTEEMAKSFQETLAPISEKIAALEAKQADYEKALEMVVKTKEDLVLERLAELPQVVKVRASELDATKTEEPTPGASTEPQTYIDQMMAQVDKSVKEVLGKAIQKDVTAKL